MTSFAKGRINADGRQMWSFISFPWLLLLLVCQPLAAWRPGSGDPCTAIQDDFQPHRSLPSNKQPRSDPLPEPCADLCPLAGLDLGLADYSCVLKLQKCSRGMKRLYSTTGILLFSHKKREAVEFRLMRRRSWPSPFVVASTRSTSRSTKRSRSKPVTVVKGWRQTAVGFRGDAGLTDPLRFG